MPYQYVTENNLVHKQNYMYSQYNGIDFLDQYLEVRQRILNLDIKQTELIFAGMDITEVELHKLYIQMKTSFDYMLCNKHDVDRYLKSFEVRKAIYTEYDSSGKPAKTAKYDNYNNYLLLGKIFLLAYEKAECLKYLNSVLKMNDILISVFYELSEAQMFCLKGIVKEEVVDIVHLIKKQGIEWKNNYDIE